MIAGILVGAVALTWVVVESIENHSTCDSNCSRCSQYSCPHRQK